MKYPVLLRAAAIAATLGAGCVLAQTATPATAASVVSDMGPPPAEERASTGAVVLENSLVQAQRANAFQRSAALNGVASVGRGVLRATLRAQTEADLAQARAGEALELQERGAASLKQR